MAPNNLSSKGCEYRVSNGRSPVDHDDINNNSHSSNNNNDSKPKKVQNNEWKFTRKDLKWTNIILITIFHIIGAWGFISFPYFQKSKTFFFELAIGILAAFGVTGGAHRFWTHRSFKAKVPLRIILAYCYITAGMNSIFDWVRDHRIHHKFSETDADPHNSDRGFFFSHVGWLMIKKHPEVIKKGRQIDMSDILADPVVQFAEKYFIPLKIVICFVMPIVVPVYFWNESWYWSTLITISRYMYVLNATWSVNSFAHIWGYKPYDRTMAPVENKYVSYATFGEGWHNYHHAFPSDYRAAEIGGGRFNLTAVVIDLFAKIGWAYELKEPSPALIRAKILNKGDGSHESLKKKH